MNPALVWTAATLFLLLLSAPARSSAAAAEPAAGKLASPAIAPREGTLANGLRYTLLPHGAGLGRISLRLVVFAGSLDEHDDELGYAHFVEHLAFEGTRHHPPGTLPQFFQSLGLAYGDDLNGHTSFTHTTYLLDLPAGRAAHFGDALEVLRDFADGLLFLPAEVERERGVILAEMGARNTDDAQVDRQRLSASFAGTRLPSRWPVGESATITRATAASLRAYYERCYQPARMHVIVVGDIEPDAVQSQIENHFASLRPRGPITSPTAPELPPSRPLQAHVITSTNTTAANVSLVSIAGLPADPREARAVQVHRYVAFTALNRRLGERRAREYARFGGAGAVLRDSPVAPFSYLGVEASSSVSDWEGAAALLETELRRVRVRGFRQAELDEQVAAWLATGRAHCEVFAGTLPEQVAAQLVTAAVARDPWRHPTQVVAEAREILLQFNPAQAAAALAPLLAPEGPQLYLTIGQAPAGGAATVAAAYQASAAQPLPPEVDPATAPLQLRYGDFGPPGRIAERRSEKDLNVDLIRFANGARLNLRPSTVEPGQFRLHLRLGRGLADLPRPRPGLGHFAAHFLGECDLGRHPQEEVERLLGLHAVSFHSTYSESQFMLEVTGPARELPFVFPLLAALVSDVRLERSRLDLGLSAYTVCRAAQLEDAAGWALHDTLRQMANDDPRLHGPGADAIRSYPFPEIEAWIRTHWLEGPLEIGVTGDFTPETVITAAATTLGALPPRRELPVATPDPLVLRTSPWRETRRQPLADQVAAVRLSWAAPNFAEPRRRRALALACAVLEDRLQHTLRQELGATYSPDVGFTGRARQRDHLFAGISLTFEPTQAEALTQRTLTLARAFAREGTTPEEFSRLREPFITKTAALLRTNEWWLTSVLDHAHADPLVITEARELATVYAELTREEINRAAAECFAGEPTAILIVLPTPPTPKAPDSSPAAALARQALGRIDQGEFVRAIADLTQAIELTPGDAELYTNRARARIGQGDYDGAITDTTRAIALDPKNAMAHNNRAVARISRQDVAGALADASRAIELDPLLALAYANRAGARLRQSDFDGAFADAAKAIELEARNSFAWLNRGLARQARGDVDGALADFTKALELDPRQADALYQRGLLRQSRNEYDAARRDFDRVIEMNPGSGDAFRQRGMIHQVRRHPAEALADYNRSLALQPDQESIHNNRGILRTEKGDFAGAIADYDAAIRLNAQSPDAHNNRGLARQGQGDLAGALADFNQAIVLDPNHANAHTNRGKLKRTQGDTFGAMDDLDKGLRLANAAARPPAPFAPPAGAPTLPVATAPGGAPVNRTPPSPALALIRLGHSKRTSPQRDFAGALAAYDEAIKQDPKAAEAYYGRGLVHDAQRDYRAAFAEFDLALTINPDFAPAYNGRGYARQMQGDATRAIADYSAALQRSPTYQPAYYNRGWARQIRGDLTGALADYDRLLRLNPNYANARANRAHLRVATGDFAGAATDYDQALAGAKASDTTALLHLFRWLNQRRLQPETSADELSRTIGKWPNGWPRTVAHYLLGELAETAFFAEADATAGRSPLTRQCESNYFAGMKHLLANDPAAARACFERSVAARQPSRAAHALARAELRRLPGPPPAK